VPGHRTLRVAVIGAGPSGVYTAEALTRQCSALSLDLAVAVLDRLPVPFGLVRYGVAPDHPSIRSIRSTLERTLDAPGVTFYGDVQVGRDLSVAELRASVDAVVYAYGAASDRRLGIPGEDLVGSLAAPELVTWYTGHPDVHPDDGGVAPGHPWVPGLLSSAREAVVVGAGNVALDVVRVLVRGVDELSTTDMPDEVLAALRGRTVRDVHVLARRGPAYTAFTTKELRELGELDDLDLLLDPGDLVLDESSTLVAEQDRVAARNLAVLAEWAGRPATGAGHRVHLHFWTSPVAIHGRDAVEGVEVSRSAVDAHGLVRPVGESWRLEAQLVVRAVGYRGLPLAGVPYDESTGRIPHAEGRVIRDGAFSPGEYVTGWIKRGPTGVIGTNRSDAAETVVSLLTDLDQGLLVPADRGDELGSLLAARGLHPLGMPEWHRIDAAELARGRQHGRQRTTLAHRGELLSAAELSED
jgi:ferredoxin--NADP+ reductase